MEVISSPMMDETEGETWSYTPEYLITIPISEDGGTVQTVAHYLIRLQSKFCRTCKIMRMKD